ncbi:MAG: ABC transporter ATP-binding protein [Propionibacteriaceae bacterium]|jgi:multidrug/hemolysin transport system ATP-binding protein|nr:ABC transporter ATP-binding protein [Propionibacteriaceae bacterium]
MGAIIEVAELTRRYGTLTAVDRISFHVEEGTLFAFLGPNGAGKSTSISVLTTLAPPSGGTVSYICPTGAKLTIGKDDAAIRQQIGVVFQDSLLDKPFNVRTNLIQRADIYAANPADADAMVNEVIEVLSLGEIAKQPYGTLSGGQRRRVDIARALLNKPRVLFLDEPTTGLDPQSRHLVWQTINQLRADLGLTVFLTTHYMEEADTADEVRIIDHGSLIAGGTPAELRAKHSSSQLRFTVNDALLDALTGYGKPFTRAADIVTLPVADSREALAFLTAHAPVIGDFEFRHGTMDDVFLNLTGANLREE